MYVYKILGLDFLYCSGMDGYVCERKERVHTLTDAQVGLNVGWLTQTAFVG